MKTYEYILSATILLVSICGCARKSAVATAADECEPLFLAVRPLPEGGYSLISLSPFDGSRDTLIISRPLSRLIVMSTSHIGFLRAIGGEDAIVGVSGAEYVYDSTVRARIGEGRILDIGYDASPDYEKIMALKPELVLTYSVSPVKSQFLTKLESLGISTFTVNEHLESHPLARASYVRLFGALTGNMSAADSVLAVVSKNYQALRDSVRALMTVSGEGPQSADAEQRICARKILVNIPYKDQWFIPGQENYLSHLVRDAGGEILGSEPGTSISGQISVERAYSLSKEASLWLNVGWCRTLDQLLSVNPLFGDFLMNIQKNAAANGFGSASGSDSAGSSASAGGSDSAGSSASVDGFVSARGSASVGESTSGEGSDSVEDSASVEGSASAGSSASVDGVVSAGDSASVGGSTSVDGFVSAGGSASVGGSASGDESTHADGQASPQVIWNDNSRQNAKGGNDFWESGVVRPDLILRDLIRILSGSTPATQLTYYQPVE